MAATISKEMEKDLNLSHFTLQNLQEAVFWVESTGRILSINEKACEQSGYTKDELMQMMVTDINPSPDLQDFKKFWQRLKKEKKITFESKHKHKTGYLYDIEITGNFIEYK